jgi:dTMP kinase
LPELEKAIEENDVVLLDRYVFSNLAYQGAKYKDEIESAKIKNWIHQLEFGFLKLPYPDLNIFFDVPMEIVEERLGNKRVGQDREYLQGKKDIHEADLGFQSKVRDNYLGLVGATNYEIVSCARVLLTANIDGSTDYQVLSPDDLFETYKSHLDYILTRPV